MEPVNSNSGCQVAIGPFLFQIEASPPSLQDSLAAQYALFRPAQALEPAVRISVGQEGSLRSPADAEPRLRLEEDRLEIDAPGYRGQWKFSGTAHLAISSSSPAAEVDFFLRAAVGVLAIQNGGVLLHSAGLVQERKAYLFFGHSGSGKTTVARLSAPRQVLNDDLVLLLPSPTGWLAYATPFWNPSQVSPQPGGAPLAGLYRLVKDDRVFLDPLSPAAGVAELLSSISILAALPSLIATATRICSQLAQGFGVSALHFCKNPSFWDAIG